MQNTLALCLGSYHPLSSREQESDQKSQASNTIMQSSSIENLEVSISVSTVDDVESVREETPPPSTKDEGSSSLTRTDLSSECRICQTEDSIDHMEAPCRCNGTLKFAHRACIQRWINSRFKNTCEICDQPYEGGFRITVSAPTRPPQPTTREIEEIRRVMEEAERLHAAAARAEIYLARLNVANNTVLSRTALWRIAILVVIGLYILIRAGNISGGLKIGIGPDSRPPSPSHLLQLSPQFTTTRDDNNNPGDWRVIDWLRIGGWRDFEIGADPHPSESQWHCS